MVDATRPIQCPSSHPDHHDPQQPSRQQQRAMMMTTTTRTKIIKGHPSRCVVLVWTILLVSCGVLPTTVSAWQSAQQPSFSPRSTKAAQSPLFFAPTSSSTNEYYADADSQSGRSFRALSRIQRMWPFSKQPRYHRRSSEQRTNPFRCHMSRTNININNNYFSNSTSGTQLQQSTNDDNINNSAETTLTDDELLQRRVQELQDENAQLTNSIQELSDSIDKLTSDNAQLVDVIATNTQIVLENFEGEDGGVEWCDELQESGACPVEPQISFGQAFRDRAVWLVGLLLLQSFSGIILSRNEALIADHPFIVYFLTMLVGAGGNAGNQASVRVIRGLALGTLNARTQGQFLAREFKMAMSLSTLLTMAGFLRAAAFSTPFPEAIAITTALFLIVFSSICLGAVLPLGLKKIGVDPAHSSTSIQVIMDILGVILAVGVSSILLDSPFGVMIMSKMTGGS